MDKCEKMLREISKSIFQHIHTYTLTCTVLGNIHAHIFQVRYVFGSHLNCLSERKKGNLEYTSKEENLVTRNESQQCNGKCCWLVNINVEKGEDDEVGMGGTGSKLIPLHNNQRTSCTHFFVKIVKLDPSKMIILNWRVMTRVC